MTFSTEINSRFSRWAESARGRVENMTARTGDRVQKGLLAAARQVERTTRMTDRVALVGSEFGEIAYRGSRNLAAVNLSFSRDLLIGARKRLEAAAAAQTLADAWHAQADTWPATRKRLNSGLKTYRETLGKTFGEMKRAAVAALAKKASPEAATARKSPRRKAKATMRKTRRASR